MFPEPRELLLIGCSIESIRTPKSKSNTLTPKTNSQAYWQRGISRVMNGNIFCVCLTLAISVLQSVLKWCRKERKKIQAKKESQQNRSRWWICSRDAVKGLSPRYLLLHQKVRWKPDTKVKLFWVQKLRSTIERGDPLNAHTHQVTQNGILIRLGLLKSGNLMNWWTIERRDPLFAHRDKFGFENDETNSYFEAESELSSGSRSFLHRKNDQVQKRQKQSSKDATKDSDKHSVIWRMFMSSTLSASVFMVKNYLEILHSIENTGKDLTMKQMFDISEKLTTEQSDEIHGVKTLNWEDSSWKYLSLVEDEQVISLLYTKV